VDWPRYRPKLVMAAKSFQKSGHIGWARLGSTEPCFDSASLYGTADAGVLGTKRAQCEHSALPGRASDAPAAIRESRLPTLVSMTRRCASSKCAMETLLFSGDNGVPLVATHRRFRGLIGYRRCLRFLNAIALIAACAAACKRARDSTAAVRLRVRRADFTISYFGANVYPENVTVASSSRAIDQWLRANLSCKPARMTIATGTVDRVELGPTLRQDRTKSTSSPSPSCATCCG